MRPNVSPKTSYWRLPTFLPIASTRSREPDRNVFDTKNTILLTTVLPIQGRPHTQGRFVRECCHPECCPPAKRVGTHQGRKHPTNQSQQVVSRPLHYDHMAWHNAPRFHRRCCRWSVVGAGSTPHATVMKIPPVESIHLNGRMPECVPRLARRYP